MDLNQFSKRMGVLANQIPENADKLVRRVSVAADQAVVMATPVDTGLARSNWVATLDTAFTGVVAEPNTNSMEQARGAIARYNGDVHASVHLTNNLDYIEKLNEGHSMQAPAGYVRISLQIATSMIRGAQLV